MAASRWSVACRVHASGAQGRTCKVARARATSPRERRRARQWRERPLATARQNKAAHTHAPRAQICDGDRHDAHTL
eukprot:5203503-Pleurochrysis_carterae.AAC.5